MRIQCKSKSNAHRSHPHCIVRNWICTCSLTLSDHTSTHLPWHLRQIFTSASHHYCISNWVDMWNTVCSSEKRIHCWYSRHEHVCHAFLVLMCNCAIQINPDRNHLWKWIRINGSRLGDQCGRAQTGFDPVQCALGVQCEQAFSGR